MYCYRVIFEIMIWYRWLSYIYSFIFITHYQKGYFKLSSYLMIFDEIEVCFVKFYFLIGESTFLLFCYSFKVSSVTVNQSFMYGIMTKELTIVIREIRINEAAD